MVKVSEVRIPLRLLASSVEKVNRNTIKIRAKKMGTAPIVSGSIK